VGVGPAQQGERPETGAPRGGGERTASPRRERATRGTSRTMMAEGKERVESGARFQGFEDNS